MLSRCYNPKNPNYRHYGGRGIRVCKRWRHSFGNFFADVGSRPKGKSARGHALYSLDRWPNNNGNYEPGNVRWATATEQIANQRVHTKQKNNTSGHTGVYSIGGKWISRIHTQGKSQYLGSFTTFAAAVRARKVAEREHYATAA
jgi:hypothetical protein